eukprot:6213271-Pleurochrysis_carterae.AAC.4
MLHRAMLRDTSRREQTCLLPPPPRQYTSVFRKESDVHSALPRTAKWKFLCISSMLSPQTRVVPVLTWNHPLELANA